MYGGDPQALGRVGCRESPEALMASHSPANFDRPGAHPSIPNFLEVDRGRFGQKNFDYGKDQIVFCGICCGSCVTGR